MVSRFREMPPARFLSLFLYGVAVHSIFVGILLVIQPPALIKMVGFRDIHEPFFPFQGGVFHMVMGIAYIYGAADLRKNRSLVIFAITVKLAATVFLCFYYFYIERIWIILVSAIIDFSMGAAIWGLLFHSSAGSDVRDKAAP